MKRTILLFGSIAVLILLLLEVSKFSLLRTSNYRELILLAVSGVFILLGIGIARLLYNKQNGRQAHETDEAVLKRFKISKQEYKVLALMSDGLSNLEIAEHLFISENTVKSHVSKILSKLNAKRRTEAIKIGRDLNII